MSKTPNVDLHALKQLLTHVPGSLRGLLEKNAALEEDNRRLRKENKAFRLVHQMDEAGMPLSGETVSEKVAALMSGGEDLDVLEQSIHINAQRSAEPTMKIAEKIDTHGTGADPIQDFLLSDDH